MIERAAERKEHAAHVRHRRVLGQLRGGSELPRCTKSSTDIENTEPKRANPSIDTELPPVKIYAWAVATWLRSHTRGVAVAAALSLIHI